MCCWSESVKPSWQCSSPTNHRDSLCYKSRSFFSFLPLQHLDEHGDNDHAAEVASETTDEVSAFAYHCMSLVCSLACLKYVIIANTEALAILCARCARWERERERERETERESLKRQRERERERKRETHTERQTEWRHHCHAEIGDVRYNLYVYTCTSYVRWVHNLLANVHN